ncbi:unnamed protein product [Linum trigynum]|uniref:Prolamin-like domain-containing protein n=1 Tax=Linum trigynum TaxID=586398 RepID=A0AAV2GVJ7_9ROSI
MATKNLLIVPVLFLLCSLIRPAESAGVGGGYWPPRPQPAQQQYPAAAAGYYRQYPSSSAGSDRRPWDPYVYGRCVGSLIMEGTCEGQILSSFWSGRVSLSAGCCESIRRVSDECVTTAFAPLTNPYFGYALKGYCASRPWIQSLD